MKGWREKGEIGKGRKGERRAEKERKMWNEWIYSQMRRYTLAILKFKDKQKRLGVQDRRANPRAAWTTTKPFLSTHKTSPQDPPEQISSSFYVTLPPGQSDTEVTGSEIYTLVCWLATVTWKLLFGLSTGEHQEHSAKVHTSWGKSPCTGTNSKTFWVGYGVQNLMPALRSRGRRVSELQASLVNS